MTKITSDENDRQRRLGQAPRQRQANVHNSELEVNATHGSGARRDRSEQKPTSDIIQQLTEKVEKLSRITESMTKPSQTR